MFGRARHDRLFARFVAGGDVHALGEVFDATAPELLRIAAHLAGSREAARDLVQNAFLIAIERRAEFDRQRRVLPWLCGIVANLARNERRRAARAVEPTRAQPTGDPAAAAEAREFRDAFARAKDALPELYRPVVDLHLEHGMPAIDIATALGRPAGTVRTQIVRGLELLRRQLPRGLVVAVLPLDLAVLAPARAAVLRHAASVVPAPVAASAVGAAVTFAFVGAGAMSKKLTAVAVVGLLVALGLWLAAPSLARGDEPAEPRVGPRAVTAAPAKHGDAAAGANGAGAAAVASPTRRERVDTPAHAAPTGSIEVTARWQHDDAPAAGIAIEVVGGDDPLGEVRARAAVTDGEGRARFERLPPGTVYVQASTGARAAAAIVADEQAAVALALEGVPVAGLVVDHLGRPVADADVWVSSQVLYARPPGAIAAARAMHVPAPAHGQHGRCTLRTDEHGRFATRLKRTQCLAAFKVGHGPSLTTFPLVGRPVSQDRANEVVLQLQPDGGALTVTVRGAGGAPVAGALVLVGAEVPTIVDRDARATVQATARVSMNLATTSSTPARRASTGDDGTASLAPLPIGRLQVQVRAADHGPWTGEVDVPAGGTAQLDVTLAAGAVVEGSVCDAGGEPLANALVHHGKLPSLRASVATTDATGAFRLEHLPAGEIEVVAFHEDWGKVSHTLHLAAGAVARWDARMPARAAITGVVLDHEGQPAPDANVGAHADSERGTASGRSDAAGRFTLSPVDPGAIYQVSAQVRLRSGGYATLHRKDVPAGAQIELRVDPAQVPSARLRGRVLQNDGKPATGVQVLVDPVSGAPGSHHPLDADGRFELGPWLPQRVRLAVHVTDTYRMPLAAFGVHELRAGTTVDAGDLVLPEPGTLRVRVTGLGDDGGVAALLRDGQHVDQQRTGDATLAWERLPPGAYSVCVSRAGARPVCGMTELQLGPGGTAEVAVAVAPATVREIGFGRRPRARSEVPARSTMEIFVGGPTFLLRAIDAEGRTVMLYRTSPELDGTATRVVVPDTATTLAAECDDGRRGSVPIAGAPGGEPLVIPLAKK